MTYRFTRRALRQLDEIANFIKVEDLQSASRFVQRVETIATLVARHPTMGRRTDLEDVRVFRIAPFAYLMFYRPSRSGAGIDILRLRHTARAEDWKEGR